MKRSLLLSFVLVSTTNAYAQTQDFFNLVGGIMNQAMQNQRAPSRSYQPPPPQ